MTTALLAFVTSGCVEPLDNNVPGIDPDAVYLPIRLYIPGAIPATKVSPTSDITGLTDNSESQIHCVQVWMFSHGGPDTESAVAYAEAGTLTGQTSNLPNGSGYYNQPYNPGQNAQNTLDWSKGYWENEYTYKLSMRIPKRILQGNNLKFDFYVLANAKSIGTTTLQAMTRGELKASKFGGGASDDFGTTSPVTEVGTNGLPISGFFNKGSNTETAANASGVDLSFLKEDKVFTLADFYENLPIVQLERAVSRIRFSFAKPTGMTGVQIIKVEIDGNQIPTSTYVFPRENGQFPAETEYEYPTNVGYVPIFQGTAATETTPATPFLSDTQIKSYENPEDLKSTSTKIFNVTGKSYNGKAPLGTSTETTMNSQQYNDLLDDYTTSKYVYLRESGKPIKGRITYSIDGTTKTKDFFMKPPEGTEGDQNPYDYPTTTNFHRNHSWTVYGYFKGGSLRLLPVVVPWVPEEQYSYDWKGEAHVAISENSQSLFSYGWTTSADNAWYNNSKPTEWFFRRQDKENPTDDDWKNDWVNSQMVIAAGPLNAAGAPIYSNKIELVSSYQDFGLTLKVNNSDFGLIVYNSVIMNGTEEVPISGFSAIMDEVVIPSGVRTTYFYVVPKSSASNNPVVPSNPKVAVSLVTNQDSPVKVPFNTSVFPGSQDNSDIFVYCVDEDTFKEYYFNTTQDGHSVRPNNIMAYGENASGKMDIVNIDN